MRYGHMAKMIFALSVLLVAGGMIGCSKKAVPTQPAMAPGAGTTQEGAIGSEDAKWRELGLFTEPERIEFQNRAQAFENEDIYFDFDSYVLSAQAKSALNRKAEFLNRYPKVRITIEGHCDERGTTEYNLALGERRANSAYQYLVNLGIDPQRMNTISYGEERPVVLGHDEEAWRKNRRDHFVVNY